MYVICITLFFNLFPSSPSFQTPPSLRPFSPSVPLQTYYSDIFIFVDAWKQSAHVDFGMLPDADPHSYETKEWMKKRLSWAYGRSARAMFITSLTTGCAFLMNLISSIVTIQAFGFFTAMMCFINYLEVITVFPAVVLTHARYFRDCPCNGCERCNAPELGSSSQTFEMAEMGGKKGANTNAGDNGKNTGMNLKDLRYLERWFHNSYGPFMIKWRWVILFLCVGFLAASGYYASELKPMSDPTQWLPDSDPVQQLFDIEANLFKSQSMVQQITVTQGLGLIDRSGINVYNADQIGNATFMPLTDIAKPASQQAYIDQCNKFKTEKYVRENEVLCPMEEFKKYVEGIQVNGTFPVPENDFITLLAQYCDYIEKSTGTPAKDFIEGDETAGSRQTRRQFELATIYQTIRWDKTENNTLRYFATVVNTTMSAIDSASAVRLVYNHWQDLIGTENAATANVAASLNNALETTRNYVDMELQDTLLQAALIGIGASLGLAAGIIFITTKDVVISFFSVLSICGVVASLVAFMVWIGWELGVIESICLTILVGLSVDYTIHLAQAYRESAADNRHDRIIDGLTSMGISVLSASATSIISACVLFGTTITFFLQFGIFIALTIALSTFYSFVFFISLLAIMGRNENQNDFRNLWRLITCKKGDD